MVNLFTCSICGVDKIINEYDVLKLDNNFLPLYSFCKSCSDENCIPKEKQKCGKCNEYKDATHFATYRNRFMANKGKRNILNGQNILTYSYRLFSNKNCASCAKKESKNSKEAKCKAPPQPEWGSLCPECNRPSYKNMNSSPSNEDSTYGWNADHKHGTTEFRRWICKPCNISNESRHRSK